MTSDVHAPRTEPHEAPSRTALHLQYLVTGAVLAGLWIWGSGEPPWVHALRTAVFVVVLLPVAYHGSQAVRARRHRPPLPAVSLTRVVATKLLLLGLALVASASIGQVTAYADEIVAAALLLIVAVGGPRCHHFFVAPARAAPLLPGRGGRR